MSIYGDAPGVEKSAAVPAAATAEPELVVPDYAPPTTAAAVASTMGAAGASAPAVQFLRKYGLNEAPVRPLPPPPSPSASSPIHSRIVDLSAP
jgi:hypothetical protein